METHITRNLGDKIQGRYIKEKQNIWQELDKHKPSIVEASPLVNGQGFSEVFTDECDGHGFAEEYEEDTTAKEEVELIKWRQK